METDTGMLFKVLKFFKGIFTRMDLKVQDFAQIFKLQDIVIFVDGQFQLNSWLKPQFHYFITVWE